MGIYSRKRKKSGFRVFILSLFVLSIFLVLGYYFFYPNNLKTVLDVNLSDKIVETQNEVEVEKVSETNENEYFQSEIDIDLSNVEYNGSKKFLDITNNGVKNFLIKFLNKRITDQIIKFFNNTKLLFNLKKILIISLLTLAIWLFEAGLFWYMFLSLDIKTNFILALLIMSTATLSTMLPSTPGYFGTFHLAIISVLSFSVDNNETIAIYAILTHLNLWLTTTLIGIFLILLNLDLFKRIKMMDFHQYITKFKNEKL